MFNCWLRKVTVEPILFLNSSIAFSFSVFLNEYLFHRISISHGLINDTSHSDSCNDSIHFNQSHSQLEKLVTSEAAQWNIYIFVPGTFICCFTSGIIGTWTDSVGRKPGLLISIFGLMSSTLLHCIVVKCSLPLYTLIISNIIYNVCGGKVLYIACCFGYLRDVSGNVGLTSALTIGEVAMSLGGCLGYSLGGFIVKRFGFFQVFLFLLVISSTSFLYIVLRLPSTSITIKDIRDLVLLKPVSGLYRLGRLLLAENMLWRIALYMLCIGISSAAIFGYKDVIVLYLISYPFCKSTFEVGIIMAATSFLWVIFIPVAKALRKPIQEYTVLVSAVVIGSVGYTAIALAKKVGILYFGLLLCVPVNLGFPVLRSQISKLVNGDFQGTIFSVVAIVENLASFFASLGYSGLYSMTAKSDFPGSVFFLSASLSCALVPMLSFVFWKSRAILQFQYTSITDHEVAVDERTN